MKKNFFIINNDFDLENQKKFFLNKKEIKINFSNTLDIYYEIGYYIITPLLVGLFLGLYLDKIFDKRCFFVLLFIFFGALFTFYNLYRIYKDNKKK